MESFNLTPQEIHTLSTMFPQGVIAMDVESTGLSPLIDKIIELSAVKISANKVETFSKLVNPEIEIPQVTIDIHHIDNNMVKNHPIIKEIMPSFLSFIGELPIIAHNAKYDLGFIIFNLHQLGIEMPKNEVFCSIKMSRKVFNDEKSHKLTDLNESLNLGRLQGHRALDDAFACLKLYAQALLKESDLSQKALIAHSYLLKVSDYSKNQELHIPERLKLLVEKIGMQEVVEIKYQGGNYKNQFRPIRPISLLPMPDGNFLYAHCLLSDQYKSFSLKKIAQVRIP